MTSRIKNVCNSYDLHPVFFFFFCVNILGLPMQLVASLACAVSYWKCFLVVELQQSPCTTEVIKFSVQIVISYQWKKVFITRKWLSMSNLWPCFWSYDTPDSKQAVADNNSHCKSLVQASH